MPRVDPLADNRRAWDDWSHVDALWSIVTAPDRRTQPWDAEEFFASGRATIDSLWATATALGVPARRARALDFGCGVGRLTRALASHVDGALGLDISTGMVERARSLNAGYDHLEFAVHQAGDLAAYPDGAFDVVCSLLVLQHIPLLGVAEAYVGELTRVLAPGGVLMLQLVNRVAPATAQPGLRARLRPRTRLGAALRAMGVSPALLSRYLGWEPPMALVPIPDDRARALLAAHGGRIVWNLPRHADGVDDRLYLVTKDGPRPV